MSVLVTGGAGYIGSHMVKALKAAGEKVVVLDNLSTGYAKAVDSEDLNVISLQESDKVAELMKAKGVEAVVHFAAFSLVGESMTTPAKYYENNVSGTLSLLRAMQMAGVNKIVFSSSAATFGDTDVMPITEDAPQNPTSVYGRSKLMMEQILTDFDMAYGIRSIALRYFNVAGAHASGEIGEAHIPETHIIPLLCKVAMGKLDKFQLYGTDYPTEDGTCIRDYIHVEDLVDAHILALNSLRDGAKSTAYNLGNGGGYSVMQIIDAVKRVVGKEIPVVEAPRRPGDPAVLVASSEKIMNELHWDPKFSLDETVASAWKWHTGHPDGYK